MKQLIEKKNELKSLAIYNYNHFKWFVKNHPKSLAVYVAIVLLALFLYSKTNFYVQLSFGDKPMAAVTDTLAPLAEDVRDDGTGIALTVANPATMDGDAQSEAERTKAKKYLMLDNREAVMAYIEHYKEEAFAQEKKYGIPAYITIAQGILESNAGKSMLATKEKNHFGIKCKTKCLGCRCMNYKDDDKYDMFRVFQTDEESFEEHSKVLLAPRYAELFKLSKSDYEGWSKGLKKCGYATSKTYDKKLIKLIEQYYLKNLYIK